MGAVAAVIQGSGSPSQPENFACVEAEKGGEWHFPRSGVAEALDDPEQPHVLASWGWLQAFLGY